MKILHLISQTPDFTGSGKFVRELIRQSGKKGHESFLFAGAQADFILPGDVMPGNKTRFVRFDGKDIDFPIPGMSDIMPYASSRFSQLSRAQLAAYMDVYEERIASAIVAFKPDLIHSHHLWIATAVARRISGDIPLVTTCHGTCLRQHHLCPHISEMIMPDLERIDRIIALSLDQKERIEKTIVSSGSKISIISGGFNTKVFYPADKSFSGTAELLYAGKLSFAKGVPWLLKSLMKIKDLPFRLHLAGSAAKQEKEYCLSLAGRLKDKAVYHGMLTHEELAGLMRKAHVFILPSFYEGLPLVLMEALACGCRVVTTALPGVHEIFERRHPEMVRMVDLPELETIDSPFEKDEPAMEENLSGILAECIRSVCAHPGFDRAYVNETVSEFAWEKIFSKIESVYRSAAG